MIYLTGATGMIGRRFRELNSKDLTTISYRNIVYDVFKSHEESCLIHLGWSSTPRDKDGMKGKYDVFNSENLFKYYLNKNPNGKIIFISSAGDMHQSKIEGDDISELSEPHPRSLYGESKLRVEEILNGLDCKTVILRTSNVWGGNVDINRTNGLVDKLMVALNTDNIIEICVDLKTTVDLIHIDDLINLILKVIDNDLEENHELFLVGGQNISIYDIISKLSRKGSLVLKLNQHGKERTFVNIQSRKAETTFNWSRENYL